MIVACAVFGKRLIAIVDRVSREEIEPLIKAAGVAEYEFFEGDANQLRQKLLTIPSTRKQDGKTEVAIDSCFPVKGVGTVALGIVQQGKCSVHQKLFFLPSGVESEVRTIQVQDENVTEADTGSRVGLGLKGIEPESVGKGDLAVEEKFAATSAVHANATLTKFYKGNLEAVQFFVFSCLNSVASKAKKTADGKYEIALSAPMPIRAGEKIVLFVPEAMPRVVGSAVVEKVV
ncbi:MAG: hypothetical protein NT051_01945 [Candidatus Micrarchaeota archaeon]|nr:hypothetical protein [Candidatus Micrarchaeota archaeon]